MTIEQDKLKNIIEAALLAVAHPMSVEQLMKLFDDEARPSASAIKDTLRQLQNDCDGRGVELKEVASGFRYQARQEYSQWLSRLWEERPAKYSRAALETLALIAYRQPVTRAEIEDVRGVGVSSSIVKTLIEREWIRVVGHRDVPGRPALYATTKQFLDYFNMKSLEELPTLSEIKDLEELNPQLDLPDPDEEKKEEQTGIDQASIEQTGIEQTATEQIGTEQTGTEQIDPEQTSAEQVDEQSSNDAHDELDDVHTEASQETFYARAEGIVEGSESLEQAESSESPNSFDEQTNTAPNETPPLSTDESTPSD